MEAKRSHGTQTEAAQKKRKGESSMVNGTEGSNGGNSPISVAAEDKGAVRHAIKSYNNQDWLHSRSAREVRILCEYVEVEDRLRMQKVLGTFLLFGSARSRSPEQWKKQMENAQERLKDPSTAAQAEADIQKLKRIEWMCAYWEKIKNLSGMLMKWIQTEEARQAVARLLREIPAPVGGSGHQYTAGDVASVTDLSEPCPVAICTGGGPGMMEAGNCGAASVAGGRSMGMGISLPFEAGLNPFVDDGLAFEFHYFFTRKFWMVYTALGVIVAPGGVGTLDELMEVLTLKQSGKMKRDIPIVLFGKKFWKDVVCFEKLVEYGVVAEKDRDQLFYTDDETEAFEYLKQFLLTDKLVLGDHYVHKSLRHAAAGSRATTSQGASPAAATQRRGADYTEAI
ncbi:putative lysine decarboxylase domain-containing protein [Neospora caninum Liverpool]|uniref:Lysine decarboxylase domain-containing protein,putative n=1 Tax=Neospora caninum (strain Liverpool) TaxID=572307 RepID=F0VKN3_NEOCL|nr:putative lysine decarboxylase domain-containing protein [Neospora caninum Liverpool]CBZ54634.1 putative lysine decarboxylase domain-containing protein [Neospora caninum Liverpool]CEL69350.1 TPA: lysine decarboxylase domain-containing protein,putative [Neospora caninum Liverpool]|eukprot:XP_003884664.1 putative lysine decarboxylase domain-containing protein [Neospora caninum Liverpool]